MSRLRTPAGSATVPLATLIHLCPSPLCAGALEDAGDPGLAAAPGAPAGRAASAVAAVWGGQAAAAVGAASAGRAAIGVEGSSEIRRSSCVSPSCSSCLSRLRCGGAPLTRESEGPGIDCHDDRREGAPRRQGSIGCRRTPRRPPPSLRPPASACGRPERAPVRRGSVSSTSPERPGPRRISTARCYSNQRMYVSLCAMFTVLRRAVNPVIGSRSQADGKPRRGLRLSA